MKSVKSSRVLNNQVTSLQWLDHALLGLLLPLLYAFFRPRVAVVVQRQWRRGTVISPLGREGRGRWCYCQTKGKRSRGGWIGRRRSGIGHCCRIVERVAADSSPGTSEPVIDLGNGEACIPGESNCLFLGRIGILEWRNSRSFLFVLLYCTYIIPLSVETARPSARQWSPLEVWISSSWPGLLPLSRLPLGRSHHRNHPGEGERQLKIVTRLYFKFWRRKIKGQRKWSLSP